MKRYLLILISITALLPYCGYASPQLAPKAHFSYVQIPMHISSPDMQRQYMLDHYWDHFDFNDTAFIEKIDEMEMLRAYATYVQHFVGPTDSAPIRRLMQRAATSRKMMDYFVRLGEKILHDPNSPLRSDELYIAVLEAQLASPHYDKYEKLAPEYDLRLARQNRVGRKANDLTYTTADARRHTLYGIKSRYTLLYINNPGCPMCRDITEALRHSSIITSKRASGELTILCLYPDEDLEAWRKEITSMPDTWIHSYDHGCVIRRMQSYDLRAIPSMYLLDAEKKVLLKDCTDVGLIERVIGR